jgi:O-antigen/teichoic acid export membrane protein
MIINSIQRLFKNIGVLSVGQIATYVFTFFFTVFTARYLGAEGYGVLAFALAFTGIFAVLSDMGLSTLMIREISRNPNLVRKFVRLSKTDHLYSLFIWFVH